jgi:F-type H+-transporting ATPase subunit delta
MNTGPIAHRYAKALLKYVQENRTGEEVYSQAGLLVLRMQGLRQLADAVQKHPELSLERKLTILDSALGAPMADPLRKFTALVYKQGRIEIFDRMLYSFIEQYRAATGIKVGRLVTAVPVPGLKDRLQSILGEQTGASVILEEKVSPDILGGFILNVDDLRMDASVEGQLRLLRRRLIDNNNRIV